jgi:hypothetical protein
MRGWCWRDATYLLLCGQGGKMNQPTDFASWLARKLQTERRLRLEAQRMLAAGEMPPLDQFLTVIADVREKYVPRIMEARENAMGTRSTRSTSVRVQARADRIRAHGLSIRYSC